MKTGETKRAGVYEMTCQKDGAKRMLLLADTGELSDGSAPVAGLAAARTRLSSATGELLKAKGVEVAFLQRDMKHADTIVCSKCDAPVAAEVFVVLADAGSRTPLVEVRPAEGEDAIPAETAEQLQELARKAFQVLSDAIYRLTLPKAPQGVWLSLARFQMGYDSQKGFVITSMMNLDTMDVRLKKVAKNNLFVDTSALAAALQQILPHGRRLAAA
jgi:hypothetical protein